MKLNVTQKLIAAHLVEGELAKGREIGLKIDQTLTQDATGTLVMLELEAMQLDRARTEVSCQYVDHNLIQEDYKNPDDHLFLLSAARRFGLWFSRPGNGISHPVHQERLGKPGKTLLGSDSHTPSAGAIGMLAIGAGGLEVAMAIAGYPFYVQTPLVWGVKLSGELRDWVSAKDVILEMLRRHGVKGGVGRVIEYYGPGLTGLSAMDRHVIANMGAELGATTSVFPSDGEVRRFLKSQGRDADWTPWMADRGCDYDLHEEIDLSKLEPLIAMPSSPDKVKRVAEVAGADVYQCYVGSSANPGFRDFAVVADIVKGRTVHTQVSLDVNPSSRQILEDLTHSGHLAALVHAGARIHQAGCNGCIGMGQAPATGKLSLRTVPRNFPGRSGTPDDQVCLVSPETAAASALTGKITDPRTLGVPYPQVRLPRKPTINAEALTPPLPLADARKVELVKGPNIASLPELEALPDSLDVTVVLKMGDNISTDEIMPAGARVLPYRSNIPRIAEFSFDVLDPEYATKAKALLERGGHAVVAGANYGQGSSREHAALAPRFLGLRLVLARGFARIHWQNLVNFGVVPLRLESPADYEILAVGERLKVEGLRRQVSESDKIHVTCTGSGRTLELVHALSPRQREVLLAGGLVNWARVNPPYAPSTAR